jgi:hydroxymethylpyrimidine pyrophosphatase-like HAD family hydrolase
MASIICDIDDTLIRAGQYGIDKTIEWLKQRAGNYKIILVTGRPESTRKETVRVLRAAGVRYNRLVMNTGSTRESNKFKLEAGKALKSAENVVLAIDNDAGARNSYRKAGIKTVSPSQLTENMLKFTF